MFRKLDPLPKQPLTRNAQILGPSQASTQFDDPPTEEIIKIEPVEKKEETAPEADDQSQVLTGWAAPQNVVPSPIRAEVMLQAAPMTFAAGASPGS